MQDSIFSPSSAGSRHSSLAPLFLLRRALWNLNFEDWFALKAKDLMTACPITATAKLLAMDAIQRMEYNRRKTMSVLPVVNVAEELVVCFDSMR